MKVDALADSFSQRSPQEIDPAWRDELVRRIESVRNGTAQSVPAEEVFASIRARFSR